MFDDDNDIVKSILSGIVFIIFIILLCAIFKKEPPEEEGFLDVLERNSRQISIEFKNISTNVHKIENNVSEIGDALVKLKNIIF